jgi:hypothetical protein
MNEDCCQHERIRTQSYEVRPPRGHRVVAAIHDALPFVIALIVGGGLVFTVVAAAVIVNLPSRRPK